MNPAKCDDLDYIHFLIVLVDAFTCTEAARRRPDGERNPGSSPFEVANLKIPWPYIRARIKNRHAGRLNFYSTYMGF